MLYKIFLLHKFKAVNIYHAKKIKSFIIYVGENYYINYNNRQLNFAYITDNLFLNIQEPSRCYKLKSSIHLV